MERPQFQGRILVIRGGAIGDFILTLPAIRALRQQFPEAFLEVLGYPHIAQLALAGGLVDRVQSIEAGALAGFFARHGKLSEDLADYFSEFNLIVSYLYDPDDIFKINVGRCTRAQFIQGPHRPNESAGVHATKVYLKPLERLAIFDADHVPRLKLNTQPPSAELLERLIHSTAVKLALVGGEAEGERLQRLAAALPPARLRVAQSLPLPQLATLLQGCAAFIGHDSGISHLAAALGLPGLILWGETARQIWQPPSERVFVLENAQGLAALPVARVLAELQKLPLG
jgi:heptosyltransferase-3